MMSEVYLRVRYSETDQMGVVYYANYFVWMEVGRTDLIRKSGLTYKEIEEKGFLLPVSYTSAKFLAPVYYDDIVLVQSVLLGVGKASLSVGYRIFRVDDNSNTRELACIGVSELVFLNKNRKVVRVPDFFKNSVKVHESEEYREVVKFIRKNLSYF
ncbi:MAG: acyl-CoA thioesterase [Brevinematia bacterium]